MQTIILTSAGFKTEKLRENLLRVLPKIPSQLKLAYITTASKVEEHRDYVDRDRGILQDLGFKIKELDIEGKNTNDLKRELSNFNVIYVQGGNTFYLLREVRRSGFDRVVKRLIDKGVIYIGVSAGSYIACPTIEMSTWNKTLQNRDRFGLQNLEAMGLVPFLLSVHYNREKYRDGLKEGIENSKYSVKILTDDQALLIEDGSVKLIGSGEEITP